MKTTHNLIQELAQVQSLLFQSEQIFLMFVPALVSSDLLDVISDNGKGEFVLKCTSLCTKPLGFFTSKESVIDLTQKSDFTVSFDKTGGNHNVIFLSQWLIAKQQSDKKRIERISV